MIESKNKRRKREFLGLFLIIAGIFVYVAVISLLRLKITFAVILAIACIYLGHLLLIAGFNRLKHLIKIKKSDSTRDSRLSLFYFRRRASYHREIYSIANLSVVMIVFVILQATLISLILRLNSSTTRDNTFFILIMILCTFLITAVIVSYIERYRQSKNLEMGSAEFPAYAEQPKRNAVPYGENYKDKSKTEWINYEDRLDIEGESYEDEESFFHYGENGKKNEFRQFTRKDLKKINRRMALGCVFFIVGIIYGLILLIYYSMQEIVLLTPIVFKTSWLALLLIFGGWNFYKHFKNLKMVALNDLGITGSEATVEPKYYFGLFLAVVFFLAGIFAFLFSIGYLTDSEAIMFGLFWIGLGCFCFYACLRLIIAFIRRRKEIWTAVEGRDKKDDIS